MSSTFSNLKFELITSGEQSGLWGNTTNTNIGTAIEQALVGMATLTSINFTDNEAILTLADTNSLQNARALCLNIAAGAVSAAGTILVPVIQKPYLVINGSSFPVTLKVSGGTGVVVPAGKRTVVYNNGSDVGNQIDYLSGLALGAPLPITSGGTGTTNTQFVNLASNVTGNLSPLNLNGGSAANSTTFWRGDGAWTAVNLSNSATGVLPIANGGTGVTTSTGSGSNVLSNSPTLVAPALGTPASGNLANCTFPTLNQNTTGNAATATTATTAITAITAANGGVTSVNGATGAVTVSGGVGVGQTWQNPARSLNTTYTNSTSAPIMVTCSARSQSAANPVTAVVSGVTILNSYTVDCCGVPQVSYFPLSFIVPAGATYQITGNGGFTVWAELR
jgi:hypothetical protein